MTAPRSDTSRRRYIWPHRPSPTSRPCSSLLVGWFLQCGDKAKPPDSTQQAIGFPGMAAAGVVVFDAEVLSREERIPAQFVWPAEDRAPSAGGCGVEEIAIPVVDLGEFLRHGDRELPRGVAEACERHGFFQVVNHGVPAALLADAYRCLDAFYARPLADKQRAQRRPGESHGYASSFTGRFRSCLPWKETLSFNCPAGTGGDTQSAAAVVDYFVDVLGEDYRHMGYRKKKPCIAIVYVHVFVTMAHETNEITHAERCTRSTPTRWRG